MGAGREAFDWAAQISLAVSIASAIAAVGDLQWRRPNGTVSLAGDFRTSRAAAQRFAAIAPNRLAGSCMTVAMMLWNVAGG